MRLLWGGKVGYYYKIQGNYMSGAAARTGKDKK